MTTINNSLDRETIEHIMNDESPVIIFGAGIVGEVLLRACREKGIKVECFCDNNINKTQFPICDTKVVYAPRLKESYNDATFLISAADIKDVVDQLRLLGYSKWSAASLLLRDFNPSVFNFNAPADFVEYAVSTCLLCQDSYLNPDKLFYRSVDIIITERCSLKCRDCSNLMQYYKQPKDCDINDLMQDVDAFCYFMDGVNEFRVIGGEPFMNREFHLIIKKLIEEPKVRKVVIYTNGTIVPGEDQIRQLKNNKVLVIITDYGKLSKRVDDLTCVLERNNIAFYAIKAKGWTDCAKISRHYRTVEQQKELFRRCCAKNTVNLTNGRLYRCPFSANAARLCAIPENERDYIDIVRERQEIVDIGETKKKIRAFLLEKDFLRACDYCNGRPFEAAEILPAEQIKKPLEYEKY